MAFIVYCGCTTTAASIGTGGDTLMIGQLENACPVNWEMLTANLSAASPHRRAVSTISGQWDRNNKISHLCPLVGDRRQRAEQSNGTFIAIASSGQSAILFCLHVYCAAASRFATCVARALAHKHTGGESFVSRQCK